MYKHVLANTRLCYVATAMQPVPQLQIRLTAHN